MERPSTFEIKSTHLPKEFVKSSCICGPHEPMQSMRSGKSESLDILDLPHKAHTKTAGFNVNLVRLPVAWNKLFVLHAYIRQLNLCGDMFNTQTKAKEAVTSL